MKMQLLPILCLVVATPSAFAVVTAKNTAGSRNAAGAGKWGPLDLGLGSAGDLAPPSFDSESSDQITVPGEGVVEDEMAALQKPTPARQTFLAAAPHTPVQSKTSLALLNAQSKGMLAGASFDAGEDEEPEVQPKVVQSATAPQVPKTTKVVEEYDVSADEDEQSDDYRTTQMKETATQEELARVQRGDVEHVKPAEHKKPKLVIRRQNLLTASQSVAKAAVKQVAAVEQAPGHEKMLNQCMAFAGWVKSQGSTGPDLVRIWKGTCMPAVMSGKAPPAYGNMCNALGTAVQKFAVRPWGPAEMCQAVLQVFKESGVGASPL